MLLKGDVDNMAASSRESQKLAELYNELFISGSSTSTSLVVAAEVMSVLMLVLIYVLFHAHFLLKIFFTSDNLSLFFITLGIRLKSSDVS